MEVSNTITIPPNSNIIRMNRISLDENLQEQYSCGSPLFPCQVYDEDIEEFISNEVPWHWHHWIEMLYVYEGEGIINAGENTYQIKKGNGIFINMDTIHQMRKIAHEPLHYYVIAFDPVLVSGASQFLFQHKYVDPVIASAELKEVPLDQEIPWQKKLLEQFLLVYELFKSQQFGYELLIRNGLTNIWLTLSEWFLRHPIVNHSNIPNSMADRTKKMLNYIEQQFGNELSIQSIAAAASISESECFRCFRRLLHVSPVDFLNGYRLRRAAEYLVMTQMTITEISSKTGFNSPSYFSKLFRKEYLCSPRNYRNKRKKKL